MPAMVINQEGCPSEMKPLHASRGAVPAFPSKGKCREAMGSHCSRVMAHGVTKVPFSRC